MELKQKVVENIKQFKLINENEVIVVGVSGGPDSMALLNILREIKEEKLIANFNIIVAHLNHMLREEAKEETEYVKEYCQKHGIKCYIEYKNIEEIAEKYKKGLEETARIIRQEFFEEIRIKENADKIAIAHNKNDNAETVIMNILRGCGINGLKGIMIKRDRYIRPILNIDRKDIEEYCEKKLLYPKIDKSNLENIYTRNKIRNVVIPYIQSEFNPNIIESIERLSDLVLIQEEYINKKMKEEYNNICRREETDIIILDLKKFNILDKVIKAKLIIHTITILFGSPEKIEKVHIEDIIRLCEKCEGNKYLTPNKNIKILIKDKKINFLKINL